MGKSTFRVKKISKNRFTNWVVDECNKLSNDVVRANTTQSQMEVKNLCTGNSWFSGLLWSPALVYLCVTQRWIGKGEDRGGKESGVLWH